MNGKLEWKDFANSLKAEVGYLCQMCYAPGLQLKPELWKCPWCGEEDIYMDKYSEYASCPRCGNDFIDTPYQELHVHHIHYIGGLEPHKYPKHLYVVLCENCHAHIHESANWRTDKETLIKAYGSLAWSYQRVYAEMLGLPKIELPQNIKKLIRQ